MEHHRRRAALALAAAVFLAGCRTAETPADSRPKDIPQIPAGFAERQLSRGRRGTKVTVFETATVRAPGGFVSSMKSWASKVTLDVPAFVLQDPGLNGRLVVFDTGLHPEMETDPKKRLGRMNYFFAPFQTKPGQNLPAQMKAAGLDPGKVGWVIVSHLHVDHAGTMDAFPNATVIVDKREWEFWREKQNKDPDPHLVDPRQYGNLKLMLVDLSTAPAFGAFDHGLDLFGDGSLVIVDLSGHTAGSIGAWANLPEGPALLAGDATWVLDNHEDFALPMKAHIFDVPSYIRRLHEMKDMQEAAPRLVIYPGHDLSPLKLHPRGDVSLSPFPR